jgi:hypothetical protein
MDIVGIERDMYLTLTNKDWLLDKFVPVNARNEIFQFFQYDVEEERKSTLIKRKDLAVRIIDKILAGNRKPPDFFGYLLDFLQRIEIGAQFFDEGVRDHIVHSLSTYFLGIFLIQKSERLKLYANRVDPLVWKIAFLLHDIGYPIEILSRQATKFFDKIQAFRYKYIPSKTEKTINQREEAKSSIGFFEEYMQSLENLYRGDNAFEVISKRLSRFGFDINLRDCFFQGIKQGYIDHGTLSSIIVLSLIDSLYARYNENSLRECWIGEVDWGRKWFDTKIVDAAAAISVHNLMTNEIFKDKSVDLADAPMLYLLVLSDTLQVWRRHSVFRKVYSPQSVGITFEQDTISCNLDIEGGAKAEAKLILEKKLSDRKLKIIIENGGFV